MTHTIVGIFRYPWPPEYRQGPLKHRTPWALYQKAVWYKANPRDEPYMQTLFAERWPEGVYINADTDPSWQETIASADKIILLYPDAIGLGFRPIESHILNIKHPHTPVHILNGRKRELLFHETTRSQLYRRRFLERFMVGEMIATVIFLIATPVLLLIDWLRGRQ